MTKSLINIIFAFILLSFTANTKTQAQQAAPADPLLKPEYSYRKYTVQDGLPEAICLALYQDTGGYIWVGAMSGFARFDGYMFKRYLADSDEAILHFYEDSHGNVSGIALKQLHQVDAGSDSVHSRRAVDVEDTYAYIISNSMPNGFGIYRVQNSRGIYAYADTGLVKVWEHEKLNDMSDTQKPYWDREGQRFFVPTRKGTYIIGENGIVTDSFSIKAIACFVPHKTGFRAVAPDGIYEYDNHNFKCILSYPFYSEGADEYDYSALEDAAGNLIIRTETAIFRFRDGKLETIADHLPPTNDICIDREGNLWVATAEGIYNFFRLNFKNHTLPKGEYIQLVLNEGQSRTWMTTLSGDLMRWDGEDAKKVNYPSSPYPYVYFDQTGTIVGDDMYFVGGGSVLQLDTKRNLFKWLDLPPDKYTHVAPLSDGNLVIGSFEFTYIYQPGKGIIRKYDISQTKQMSLSGLVDKQGRILLGGASGLVIIDGDSLRHLTGNELKMCRNMAFDHSGRLWLTCRNNLVMMTGDEPEVIHAFPNTLIRNIFFTRDNIMIVATLDALYLSRNPGKNPEFIRYDQYNGFNSLGTFSTPMAEDSEGNIWLLSLSGAIRFNPEELMQEQPVPLLHTQAVQSSRDNINWANVSLEHPEWGYKDNNVKFSYVGLCYSAVENVRYHYRLPGFQNDWSEPTNQREITFNNLPPGNYTFEIYADAGTDGSRSGTQTFAFDIKPAFWQTVWFLAACVVFLILASAGVALYIQRRRNKALLEKLRAEKELNELRISAIRLKAIPHFNANILAAIEYYIANRTREEVMHILGIYSDFTFQTLSEVDKAARPLSEELAYVKMYLDLEKIRFLDKFDFRIEVDEGVNEGVQLPNMILHTYCENAVKHGLMPLTSGGLLTIHVSQHSQIVVVSVEDNGVGRAYAAHNRQVHSSKQGLSILNRQIEIYNRFNSEKISQHVEDLTRDGAACGTLFRVEVPEGYTYIN